MPSPVDTPRGDWLERTADVALAETLRKAAAYDWLCSHAERFPTLPLWVAMEHAREEADRGR